MPSPEPEPEPSPEPGESYAVQAVGVAAVLGFLSAAWGFAELATGRIAEDRRPGFARERTILWYTSSYLAGVMWLSLRLSPLYPAALTPLDPALCAATIGVYVYGFVSPLRTVLVHWEELTPTEQLRMKGMVASGAVGPNPKPNPNPNPKPEPKPNPNPKPKPNP